MQTVEDSPLVGGNLAIKKTGAGSNFPVDGMG